MKRENIIAFVQDPSKLDQSSLGELEELLITYPWFQTAHLLVAKNHHNIDSIKFHEVLRDSATYAGDRTVLYHLINTPAPPKEFNWMAEPDKSLSDIAFQETGPVEKFPEPAEKLPEPEQELPEPEQKLPDPEPALDGEEKFVFTAAYQLKEEPPPTETTAIEEYTFTGWFEHFQSITPEKPPGKKEDDLIDKFIKDSPAMSRFKEPPPPGKDLSDASSWDKDSFMTETLARIYEKQGLLKKAIFAYEKLSLKYPEKSTYFASQINRLKSQLEKN